MCQQKWEQFCDECADKKVFLFGIGIASKYFIAHYHTKINLEGVIDNDLKKQGFMVSDFIAEALGTRYENMLVSGISVLEHYSCEEIAVIVTSMNYYEQIEKQVRQHGVSNCYLMFADHETEWRQRIDSYQSDTKKRIEEYIETCYSLDIDEKKVVVYIGYYGGHGKYITEQMLRLRQDIDIVWIVKDLSIDRPLGVRLIYEDNWRKYIYEMETAQIWIFDTLVPLHIKKRPQQIYIQTKHWAGITLKKFFLEDSSTVSSKEEIEYVKYNGKMMDYILTGSRFDEETCRRGFDFQGECIRVGSPRSDALFCKENKDKVYALYQIPSHIHCVLYAPTFRYIKTEHRKHFDIELDFAMLKKALEKRFGGEWYILLRLHPSLKKGKKQIGEAAYLIDACEYDDSQELIAASDIVISDYSSIMFEPAFVHNPVFLFAPDRKAYISKERDLLLDYDSLPFPIAETNEGLIKNIEQYEQGRYQDQVISFLNRYGVCEDGHASERAAKFILGLVGQNSV